MATEAYDVVGSLREMLQSQERREQSKVQTALASMQFAQQKKMQDIQLAGQQLQFLQTVNTQAMTGQATDFLTSTGLGAIYSEDEDGVEDAIETLTKKPKKGGFGFSEADANRIATAVWMSYKGSPSAILSIADELNTGFKKEKPSTNELSLIKGFVASGYITEEEFTSGKQESGQLDSMSKTIQNTKDISAEMYEYGRGEYEIQRDIGAFEPIKGKVKSEESQQDLSRALDEFEKIGSPEQEQVTPMLNPNVKTSKDITSDYNILPEAARKAAESKLAGLDMSLGTLTSEYESLLDERESIVDSMDDNAQDYSRAVKAYDLSVRTGLNVTDLEVLASKAKENKSAYDNARREYLAVQEFQKNPRILSNAIRYGDDWRVSVSGAQMKPDPNIDYFNLEGQVPMDLGTINLTGTSTFKMAELATKIRSIQSQRESLDIGL
jgi:hypothetical protein|tara:strand:- start:4400 stop:5716 length:1317 start_codon:yes stop_codon:yes gene_type:complete